jgi:hypothetical protein
MRYYSNPNCTSTEEFASDLATIVHIKRLLNRYARDPKELKIRLLLNHLTLFYNVFSPPFATTRMLIFKLPDHLSRLKPLLIALGYWPSDEVIPLVAEKNIQSSDISLDPVIVRALREEFSHV